MCAGKAALDRCFVFSRSVVWSKIGLIYLQEMEEHELWGEADQPAPDVGEGAPDQPVVATMHFVQSKHA